MRLYLRILILSYLIDLYISHSVPGEGKSCKRSMTNAEGLHADKE